MKTCAHGNRAGGRELPAAALPLIGESNDKPRRIQLKRTKGWQMPANTVKVDRRTKWGNPFIVNPHVKAGSKSGACYVCVPTIEDAVETYREYMSLHGRTEQAIGELRGKNLACWCKPGSPCHADVLLELANSAPGGSKASAVSEPVNPTSSEAVNPNPGDLEAQNQ